MGYYSDFYSREDVIASWSKAQGVSLTAIQWLGELQDYAQERYNEGGWDFVVECWDPAIVQGVMNDRSVDSLEMLIKEVSKIVGIQDERRREIQSYADY